MSFFLLYTCTYFQVYSKKLYNLLLYTSQNVLGLIKRLMSSLMLQSMGMNLTFNRIQAQSDLFFACMFLDELLILMKTVV